MAQSFFHETMTLFVIGQAVTDVAVLSDTSNDIVEIDESDNLVSCFLKNEKLERLVATEFFEIDFQLQPPSIQIEKITGPTRTSLL